MESQFEEIKRLCKLKLIEIDERFKRLESRPLSERERGFDLLIEEFKAELEETEKGGKFILTDLEKRIETYRSSRPQQLNEKLDLELEELQELHKLMLTEMGGRLERYKSASDRLFMELQLDEIESFFQSGVEDIMEQLGQPVNGESGNTWKRGNSRCKCGECLECCYMKWVPILLLFLIFNAIINAISLHK